MKQITRQILSVAAVLFLFFATAMELTAQYNPSDEEKISSSQRALMEFNTVPVPDDDTPLAIINCRLIDGLGGSPVENAVVLLEKNRIVDAGTAEDVNIPEYAHLYDTEGKTVMPGLIDAHFHSVNDNQRIHRYLRKGVTTMRDPGHPFRFYQSLHFSDIAVPRVFLTGAHLDGFPPVWGQQAFIARDGKHAREIVFNHVKNGGTGIKLYFKLPLEYYEFITDAAAQAGVPVMAHLELVDADDAILAGLEGVEHVTSFGTALAPPEAVRLFKERVDANYGTRGLERFRLWASIDIESKKVLEVIDLAVRKNVIMTPTLGVFERYADDEGVEDFHVKGYKNMIQFVKKAYNAGMRIAVGSHAALPHAENGWDYQHEMQLLVDEVGMEPMDVIVSSTMGNARYFRTNKRLGSIEPGKLADLILIEGNPDEDISHMRNIGKVMLNGIWIETE